VSSRNEFSKRVLETSSGKLVLRGEFSEASSRQGVYIIRWDFNEVFMFHVFKK
jgi:hypothetical protein